jgi:hypothetical protein
MRRCLSKDYHQRNHFSSDIVRQPFTHGFPRADIHELLTPDLLHQVIKGTFKDHLVAWVNDYLLDEYGPRRAYAIIEDIDHRYAFNSLVNILN